VEAGSSQTTEILTFSPSDRGREQWLQRVGSGFSQQLEYIRERLFDLAGVQRHHLLLDLNASTGLLTWEALRRAPEGGVWALVTDAQSATAMREQAARLPEVERPAILSGAIHDLPALIEELGQVDLRFDVIMGRNVLTRQVDKPAIARVVSDFLASGGRILLAEVIPRQAQRLYQLADLTTLEDDLAERIVQIEESIYQNEDDPMVNWGANDLEQAFTSAGLEVDMSVESDIRQSQVTSAQLNRWFDPTPNGDRMSYAGHLLKDGALDQNDLAHYKALLAQKIDQPLSWTTTIAFLRIKRVTLPE